LEADLTDWFTFVWSSGRSWAAAGTGKHSMKVSPATANRFAKSLSAFI
jgi:hypothetical protein